MNPYAYYQATEEGQDPIYFRESIVTGRIEVLTDVGEWFEQPHITIETLRWAYTPDTGYERVSFKSLSAYDLPEGAR